MASRSASSTRRLLSNQPPRLRRPGETALLIERDGAGNGEEPPEVFEPAASYRPHFEVVARIDEIQCVARSDPQTLPNFLGDSNLSLRGHSGACHRRMLLPYILYRFPYILFPRDLKGKPHGIAYLIAWRARTRSALLGSLLSAVPGRQGRGSRFRSRQPGDRRQ